MQADFHHMHEEKNVRKIDQYFVTIFQHFLHEFLLVLALRPFLNFVAHFISFFIGVVHFIRLILLTHNRVRGAARTFSHFSGCGNECVCVCVCASASEHAYIAFVRVCLCLCECVCASASVYYIE